jgi:hypothetical protein
LRGVDHGSGARLCLTCQHSLLQILERWILGNSCEVSGTYRRFAVRLAEGEGMRREPSLCCPSGFARLRVGQDPFHLIFGGRSRAYKRLSPHLGIAHPSPDRHRRCLQARHLSAHHP